MRTSKKRYWLAATGLFMAVCLSSGCSTFRGSRVMDMSPFAENTSYMFAEAAKVSRPFPAVYLRPYIPLGEMVELRERGATVINGLRGLVLYSNQVVALNNAPKSDREKNRLLAEYLQEATANVADREKLLALGITAGALDSTLAAIRDADKFLDGVAAASPLVNVVVLALLDGLEAINATIPEFIAVVDAEIERNFRETRVAYQGLTERRAQYMIAANLLYQSRSGNPTAVDSLLRVDPSMARFIPDPERVTPQQLDAAEQELVGRLERIGSLIEQLAFDRTAYVAIQKELTDLRLNLDERIRIARDAIVIWGQSHRNLGAGVPVPPLISISSIASGVVRASPLP